MDDERSPEPGEIAPHDRDAPWRRPVGPEVTPQAYAPIEVKPTPPSPEFVDETSSLGERRRIPTRTVAAIAVAVVAVGLFAGWAIGRSDNEPAAVDAADPSSSSSTTTTIPATTTTTQQPPVATVPEVQPVVTAAPVTTTGTGWTSQPAEIDQRVRGLGIRIVAVRPGELLDFDTFDNKVATREMRGGFRRAPYLDAGEGWILLRNADNAQTQLFRGLDDPMPIDTGTPATTYRQQGTDRFWKSEPLEGRRETTVAGIDPDAPQPRRLTEIDHEGHPTGVWLETSSRHSVLGADPAGGIVVAAPGGAYHLGDDGTSRLTTGQLIAVSAARALAVDCGDGLSATCGLEVLDRATGAITPLQPVVPDSIVAGDSVYGFYNPSLVAGPLSMPVSPDDTYAPIVVWGSVLSFGVIDLATGEYIELSDRPQSDLWWMPDGHAVLYLDQHRLLMYDFGTRQRIDVLPDYEIWSFTVRG